MKANKKLLASAMALGLAGLTTVGSTYAWFAMNRTVTATGMAVKATTSTTLLISKDNAQDSTKNNRLTNGDTTINLAEVGTTVSLSPTSTVNGTDWFTAKGATTSASGALTGSYEKVSSDDEAKYFLKKEMYVQNFDSAKTGNSGEKLVLDKVTVSYTTGDNLNASFRVLVVCGDKNVFVAPTTTIAPTNQGVKSVDAGSATLENITFATSSYTGTTATITANNVLIDDVEYNTVTKITVYVYFDGEDSSCYTDNIPETLNDYTVGVSYSLA